MNNKRLINLNKIWKINVFEKRRYDRIKYFEERKYRFWPNKPAGYYNNDDILIDDIIAYMKEHDAYIENNIFYSKPHVSIDYCDYYFDTIRELNNWVQDVINTNPHIVLV